MSVLIPASSLAETAATATTANQPLLASYGGERITFSRAPRKAATGKTNTKSVLIKVHPDCRVVALAPESASDAEVITAVQKRGRWVHTQLKEFRSQNEHILPRQYISGETHLYLGRQYQLKVNVAESYAQGVKLLRGVLEVYVTDSSPANVQRVLSVWYRLRAREVFRERLVQLVPQALWLESLPPIRLFDMKKQWGNCSPNGLLTLNPHLVKAPKACIDYVLLHELCHIAEHNHSDRFYRLMSQVMPQWEGTKQRLDEMAGRLLA